MTLFNTADLEDAYRQFLQRGQVWVLVSPEQAGAVVDSNHATDADGAPMTVELVFSARAYASRVARGDWSNYTPIALSLETYLTQVLPGLSELDRLILPDPTKNSPASR